MPGGGFERAGAGSAPHPGEPMRAWATAGRAGQIESVVRPVPDIREDELLVRVEACGVCRTDLHIIDRDLPPHRAGVVPGHQVVGTVVRAGSAVRHGRVGERVGVAWLRRTCGECRWCREGRENLCPDSEYTGWDADGGFAEFTTVPAAFAYPLPEGTGATALAPLLCAGIIGYRALERSNLPPGGRLGIYGFGSSAHITAAIAAASGARLFVMTRGERAKDLARSMGAAFVGDATESPPERVDSAIVFAPAGELVPLALRATDRGGTVVVAGIHMSRIPAMDYDTELFDERDLRSVTANTRADGTALLRVTENLRIVPAVTAYPFSRTPEAIADLRAGATAGSLVIVADGGPPPESA